MMRNNPTGFAIAIAWPETYCKQPGSWYDGITRVLGANRYNYYKAGHAALVLVDAENLKCHYFDFGRYHAPFQHGRVRNADTDFDLAMNTVPEIPSDRSALLNFQDILSELQNNPACHGDGTLYASYCQVDFKTAITRAQTMSEAGPIAYGPFRYGGSNCSRFVNTVILAGKPAPRYSIKLKYLVPLTPTPLNNVDSLDHKKILPKMDGLPVSCPARRLNRQQQLSTLPEPARHPSIPAYARWLSGEGAGSWFSISYEGDYIRAIRYSPKGEPECSALFSADNEQLRHDLHDYEITYPSNCREIVIAANGKKHYLRRSVPESVIY